MLDQNTDRMWYVIGAIVIGAAIIAMGLNIFSESFDSVEDNFGIVAGVAEDTIDSMGYTVSHIVPADNLYASIHPGRAELVSYDSINNSWKLKLPHNVSGWSGGLTMKNDKYEVPFGYRLLISYDVKSPITSYASNDINNRLSAPSEFSRSSDNDHLTYRVNARQSVNTLPQNKVIANEWTNITFGYQNTDPLNKDKISLMDYSTFGVHNSTVEDIVVEIRNVKISIEPVV